MGLLDYIIRKKVTDESKFLRASVSSSGSSRAVPPPLSPAASVKEYQSWVYAAATLNAQAVAAVPLRLYVRAAANADKVFTTRQVSKARAAYLRGDLERRPGSTVTKASALAGDFEEVIDAHPLMELLARANATEDGFGLAVSRILFLELTGNAYLHVVTDPVLGIPSELWTVPAHHVTIMPAEDRLIAAYRYGISRTSAIDFAPDEMIHFRRPNPRSMYYGLGKVEAAWRAISQSNAIHEQDLAFAENNSRPDYAAIIKGGASADALRRFEESMKGLHGGPRKSGRMVAITGDVELKPLAFPSKDTAGRDDIVEEIAAVFGVPVSMLKANDPNLASATAGYASWRETTVAPICRLDEDTLNARLVPLFGLEGDAYLAYDDPVPKARAADAAERSAAVVGGWRTPNEARVEEGYDALDAPGADALRIPPQPLAPMPTLAPTLAPVAASLAVEPTKTAALEPSAAKATIDILSRLHEGTIGQNAATELIILLGISPESAQRMTASNAPAPAALNDAQERTLARVAQVEAKAYADALAPDPRLADLEKQITLLTVGAGMSARMSAIIEAAIAAEDASSGA